MSWSYCYNWGTAQCLNPEISCSFQQLGKDLAGDYLSVSGSDSSLALLDTFIDPFIQPGELIYSESQNMTSFSHEESESYQYYDPECQNTFPNYYCSNIGSNFFTRNDLAAPPAIEFLQEFPAPFPEFQLPEYEISAAFNWGRWSENEKKASGVGQSIAARERRRKISEKTQELGKLIPGAHKMNTAQMLQAAYKYVQFLQAQVGVLKAMWSVNNKEVQQVDKKEALLMQPEELGMLLASTAIEEKLYSEQKCLVPLDLVS